MRLFFLSIFILLFLLSSRGQNFAESGSGSYLALAGPSHPVNGSQKKEYSAEIRIFSFVRKAQIQTLSILESKPFKIDTLIFSPAGGILMARTKDQDTWIFNCKTGRLIAVVPYHPVVAFHPNDERIYIKKEKFIEVYNPKTRKIISNYKFSGNESFRQLTVTEDEHYLIGQTDLHVWVWDLTKGGAGKRYNGSSFAYDASRGLLTLLTTANNLTSTTLQLSSDKVVARSKFSQYQKKIGLKIDSLLRESKGNVPSGQKIKTEVLASTSKLSNGGTFVAMSCRIRGSQGGIVLLMNNITHEFSLYPIEEHGQPDFNWVSDSLLVLHNSASTYYFIDPRGNASPVKLMAECEFGKSANERILTPKKQLEIRKWSPNYRYIALPETFKGRDRIYLRPTLIRQNKTLADTARFLCFSGNSALVYFIGEKNKLGYISTEDVEGDLDNGPLKRVYFADSLIIPVQGEITDDPEAPAGYHFPRITSFKHISEATTSNPPRLYFKTMNIGGQENGLQVQLIDSNGVYYYGAADSAWKKIWCNLLLTLPDNSIRQIMDFSVAEYREDTSYLNAMCVALDFSGSMGKRRGDRLQNGVLSFIDSKLENEGIGVIKYDGKVVEECEVTGNKDELSVSMNRTPYFRMGGSTALLNALDASIKLLDENKNYDGKFIILLTDGDENASAVTKKEVITEALKHNIRIFIIGLGEYVSEGYLKSLAYNTQGSYYRIYNSQNLDWIYQDIRNKVKNYYTIAFHTEQVNQTYKALLNICLENKYTDTLAVTFDNTLIKDKLKRTKLKDEEIIAPFDELNKKPNSDMMNCFQPISDFSKIRSGLAKQGLTLEETLKLKDLKNQKNNEKTDVKPDLKEAFDQIEFPSIKFEFDKTIIVKGTDDGIENVVAFLKAHPDQKIEVQGHTDNRGSDEHNQPLSQARAEVVKARLVSMGISVERIKATGYGSAQPLVPNTNDENRQINRRIDFVLLGK